MLRRSLKQTEESVKGSSVFNRRLYHRWPLPSTPSSAYPLITRRQFEWVVGRLPAKPLERSHSLCGFVACATWLDSQAGLVAEGHPFRLLTATECHPFFSLKWTFIGENSIPLL